ncbi:MAG: hypothetical protein NT124_04745 [Candidatus Dependentiae bacterium]|nr:hypothetical protein [Candidatus Dependentiae bacterium]
MFRIIKRKDYWLIACLVALSIALKICSIVILYAHAEHRNALSYIHNTLN